MKEITQETLMIVTTKARADKAISTLKGLLLGLNIDGNVNQQELRELQEWAEAHNELIHRNPFNEFMTIIQETIAERMSLEEAVDDLYWLCQKYENDSYYYNAVTADLQTLQGLCHGILADGIVGEEEVFSLHKWLQENEHLSTYYPYDEIRSLVLSVVDDKKVDEEEKLVLKAYFNQFSTIHNEEIAEQIRAETSDVHISGLCTSEPNVTFPGKTFCITGVLQRGNRKQLQENIQRLGGIPTNSVSRKTDYLIVGDNGNPAWAFACYGRKIETALGLRKDGHTIMLIHEFDFADIVDDML